MKLRDVGTIDPEVVLFANPVAEAVAFHGLGADLERRFGEYLLRQLEVFERILPALFVRAFGGTALARECAALLHADVFANEVLTIAGDFVIAVGEPL